MTLDTISSLPCPEPACEAALGHGKGSLLAGAAAAGKGGLDVGCPSVTLPGLGSVAGILWLSRGGTDGADVGDFSDASRACP